MVKSTSFLISQQCELINSQNDNKKKKRVHNILTEQLNLLNNPPSYAEIVNNPTGLKTSLTNKSIKPIRGVGTLSQINNNPNISKSKSSPIISRNNKVVSKVKKGTKEVKKTNKIDKNFIELLTGENNSVQSDFNPTLKLREQVCQSHVMKSLGGYKFIEGNKFDNFVISILPKIENNKLTSKY